MLLNGVVVHSVVDVVAVIVVVVVGFSTSNESRCLLVSGCSVRGRCQ